MKHKSQVTIFIILFVVGLILAFSIFSIRNFLVQNTLTSNQNGPYTSLDSTTFMPYFETCVQTELQDVLSLALSQGGYLFEKDNGPNQLGDVSHENNRLIYINSLSNDLPFLYNLDKNFKPVSIYTGLFTKDFYGHPRGIFNVNSKHPYFGELNLPPLCVKGGPNDPLSPQSKFSCPSAMYNIGLLDEDKTLQTQLSKIMASKIFQCVESPIIIDRYSLSLSDFTKIDIIFGEDELIIKSDLEISYIEDGVKINTPLNLKYDLDFKTFYSFIYDILDKESKSIDFNISKDYFSSPYYSDPYVVNLTKDFIGTSDLLEVTNTRYKESESSALKFIGLIQNRRPYLEYIENITLNGRDQGIYALPATTRTKSFILHGLDPDGDEVYSLSSVQIIDSSPISQDFNSLINTTDGVNFVYSVTGNCSSHCNKSNSKFIETVYTMNASISDGTLDDYQTFSIKIIP